ncbi:MAG: Mrp/NBP35 family ATP-binding protein [Clostridia bacterium]|nr:Mrp/NBP35 family ATP-binding protein [Clostridia bacterium]
MANNEENEVVNEENCTHDCSTCGADCPSKQQKQDLIAPQNKLSNVKKVIGIVSGKGGVGKSLTTALLAVSFSRMEFNTAILDADITGPSIPKMFGLRGGKVQGTDDGMFPLETTTGIKMMSTNLLLPYEEAPVIWRGPVIAGTVRQFWTDVIWDDVDYMFVDMPPGTGDVALTVFQSIPLDGIIVVTTPQELVSMIVGKAVNMAKMMNIPILGLVENMSYVECPDCGKKLYVFGESKIEEVAKEYGLEVLARMPFDAKLSAACDKGAIELTDTEILGDCAEKIFEKTKKA